MKGIFLGLIFTILISNNLCFVCSSLPRLTALDVTQVLGEDESSIETPSPHNEERLVYRRENTNTEVSQTQHSNLIMNNEQVSDVSIIFYPESPPALYSDSMICNSNYRIQNVVHQPALTSVKSGNSSHAMESNAPTLRPTNQSGHDRLKKMLDVKLKAKAWALIMSRKKEELLAADDDGNT